MMTADTPEPHRPATALAPHPEKLPPIPGLPFGAHGVSLAFRSREEAEHFAEVWQIVPDIAQREHGSNVWLKLRPASFEAGLYSMLNATPNP